jgi:hypothetical protein
MEHEYEYDEIFEHEIPLEDQALDERGGGFDDPELRGSWDDPGEYDEYDDEFDDLEPGSGSREDY